MYEDPNKFYANHFIGMHARDLYTLADRCNYGALHNEMVRDRIVVAIRDLLLTEKL